MILKINWIKGLINSNGGERLYIKELSESEKIQLKQRANKIKELQEQGICFGCYNFETQEIFPGEGLIIYEDDKVRCQFEKFPRATGQTTIVAKDHYEDISLCNFIIAFDIFNI